MAANAPDPKTLKTWEEAFKYPIPAVRRMEQQLRTDVAANKEKLRRLVGASYRDLLTTAERIVEMDESMKHVEEDLSEVSRNCNSKVIDVISKNYGNFERTLKAPDEERYAVAFQLVWFQSCPAVIARSLRRSGSSLMAAKVLVMCRLLHKSLVKSADNFPLIESIRHRLASLREKLLRRLDVDFGNGKPTISRTLENMCAFLLATSSTPTDVLRHFLHIRLEAIRHLLTKSHEEQLNVSRAMSLYLRTIQDIRALLPTQLAGVLIKLRSRPLMHDPDIRNLVELDLEVGKRWFPEDIRNFIPWLRHDVLQKSEVEIALDTWSNNAFDMFVQGLRKLLKSLEDIDLVVQLRFQILQTWFNQDTNSATQLKHLKVLRMAFNDRLRELIKGMVRRLDVVGNEISEAFRRWNIGASDTEEDLWAVSRALMDVRNDAVKIKATVLDSLYGRNNTHRRVLENYQRWLGLVRETMAVFKELRKQKWGAEFEAEEDDDSGFDLLNAQLSEEDPKALEGCLEEAVVSAFGELQDMIQDSVSVFSPEYRGRQAILLLRVVRDIRRQLPPEGDTSSFGLLVAPRLHAILAETASKNALEKLRKQLEKSDPDASAAQFTLWHGSPPLPIQPSPAIFNFVYELVSSMAKDGGDLWTNSAVARLKLHVSERLATILDKSTTQPTPGTDHEEGHAMDGANEEKSSSEPSVEGHVPSDISPDDTTQELEVKSKTQMFFDVLFLRLVLSVPSVEEGTESALADLEKRLLPADIASSADRLRKSAHEFWKRTTGLFSLLA